jgi:hypothetical protein
MLVQQRIPTKTILFSGGVSVFESQAQWITQELEKIAAGIQPADPHAVEFHASEVFSGRTAPWKMSRDEA